MVEAEQQLLDVPEDSKVQSSTKDNVAEENIEVEANNKEDNQQNQENEAPQVEVDEGEIPLKPEISNQVEAELIQNEDIKENNNSNGVNAEDKVINNDKVQENEIKKEAEVVTEANQKQDDDDKINSMTSHEYLQNFVANSLYQTMSSLVSTTPRPINPCKVLGTALLKGKSEDGKDEVPTSTEPEQMNENESNAELRQKLDSYDDKSYLEKFVTPKVHPILIGIVQRRSKSPVEDLAKSLLISKDITIEELNS
ncbi:MAG: hypothetical protein MHPSP_000016 [Paramarteilia canceri]